MSDSKIIEIAHDSRARIPDDSLTRGLFEQVANVRHECVRVRQYRVADHDLFDREGALYPDGPLRCAGLRHARRVYTTGGPRGPDGLLLSVLFRI